MTINETPTTRKIHSIRIDRALNNIMVAFENEQGHTTGGAIIRREDGKLRYSKTEITAEEVSLVKSLAKRDGEYHNWYGQRAQAENAENRRLYESKTWILRD